MIIWPWMHLIVGAVLIVAVIVGLLGPAQASKICVMVARVCYVLILISGIVMVVMSLMHGPVRHPVLLIVKLALALAAIGLVEISFARKKKNAVLTLDVWIPVALIVVVVVLGFVLTGGFPIVMK
jgi:phosphoglycerol transferase MdoB-like AlkP superfamily enzyme